MRPFLSLSARENRFSSRLLADASGGAGKLGKHTGRCHSRWGRRWKLRRLGGSALPKEEGSGQEQETGRSPGKETRQGGSPST